MDRGNRRLKNLQQEWMGRHAELWQGMLGKPLDQPAPQVAAPAPGDKRFDHPSWAESPVYDYLRQSYLINAEYMKRMAEAAPVPEGQGKNRMRFLTRQMVDAMAPSNFLATNPSSSRPRWRPRARASRRASRTCWPTWTRAAFR
jgi:polyhydroxyalkanoate synthase